MDSMLVFSSIIIVILLAISLQVLFFSPISPEILEIPSASKTFTTAFTSNPYLQSVSKLGEGFLDRPEDVAMDKMGILYTATRDGWIKRKHNNGTWENWKYIGRGTLLGLTVSSAGHIIVCDAEEGLLKVSEDGASVLASRVNGEKISIIYNANQVHHCYNIEPIKFGEIDSGTKFIVSYAVKFGPNYLIPITEEIRQMFRVKEPLLLSPYHIEGTDDVVEASDGSLYFSVASTKFGLHEWYLDVLEAKPHGQLLKYNPSLNQTSVILDNLAFANGVTLSADEDYLIVCESWKFRCLKYWLKEEIKGQTDIFVDNLPGAPDNIKLAPDGSFWIALLEFTPPRLNFIHSSRASKHLLAAFPKLINWVNGAYHKAMVVNVAADGKITKGFDDPTGKVMSFVTSVLEHEDHLYLGSLNCDFIGKLPLTTSTV